MHKLDSHQQKIKIFVSCVTMYQSNEVKLILGIFVDTEWGQVYAQKYTYWYVNPF